MHKLFPFFYRIFKLFYSTFYQTNVDSHHYHNINCLPCWFRADEFGWIFLRYRWENIVNKQWWIICFVFSWILLYRLDGFCYWKTDDVWENSKVWLGKKEIGGESWFSWICSINILIISSFSRFITMLFFDFGTPLTFES